MCATGKGLFYHDQPSLEKQLLGFDRKAARLQDWNAYRPFEPEPVMAIFRKVFLEPGLHADLHGACSAAGNGDEAEGGGDEEAAKRMYQQLASGGGRMPCYGK